MQRNEGGLGLTSQLRLIRSAERRHDGVFAWHDVREPETAVRADNHSARAGAVVDVKVQTDASLCGRQPGGIEHGATDRERPAAAHHDLELRCGTLADGDQGRLPLVDSRWIAGAQQLLLRDCATVARRRQRLGFGAEAVAPRRDPENAQQAAIVGHPGPARVHLMTAVRGHQSDTNP